MRCIHVLVLVLVVIPATALAQAKQGQARLDSLLAEIPKMKDDTNGVKLMNGISYGYARINPDEGLKWAGKALALAQKTGWRAGEAVAYEDIGYNYLNKGT